MSSLIWPTGAGTTERIDQDEANMDGHSVTLSTPGLYVYFCKLHPYMLGAVIVDHPGTTGLDLGATNIELAVATSTIVSSPTSVSLPITSNAAARLLRAFFIVTNPGNWKDYTKVGTTYQPLYPDVPVYVGPTDDSGAKVPSLRDYLLTFNFDGGTIAAQVKPAIKGVGEVWVDTQYELAQEKGASYPGTMTAVNANSWNVRRKVALPSRLMNNGHNIWPSHNQNLLYQTEWHGNSLFVINRITGRLLREIEIGHDPAHVMTRVDTQQVHVGLNGEDYVVELNKVPAPEYLRINRYIKTSLKDVSDPAWKPTQPHAHWMGFDGKSMVTPNANTDTSTLYTFNDANSGQIVSENATAGLSIATGMMPDSSKYYVSNYLGHAISVMNGPTAIPAGGYTGNLTGTTNGAGPYNPGEKIKDIPLLLNGNYNAGTGAITGPIGGLPVQTPVSPDGKFVIQGNTFTGTITIIDTASDTLVASIPCDPGCHGVQFGAKKGGGYYAYVTSKFANRLIVVDYDKDNNGILDAVGNIASATELIAGAVVLANDTAPRDAWINDNLGMGGQGVMSIPNVYNGWVQKLPDAWKLQLTAKQRKPFP